MAVTNNALISGASFLTDSVAANAAVAVKASSATLYEIEFDNTANAAASYLKFYNTGSVTVGTTVPDMVLLAPASTKVTWVAPGGTVFGTALSYACVTAGGTAGTSSPSSSVLVKLVYV